MTHAAARRRGASGDESHHRLLHMILDILRRGLFGIAADLADHHDGVRIRIFVEQFERVHEVGPDNRIAANADASGLTDSELRQLADRFIRERARTRYHADVSLLVDMARHDADLALAGRDHAGAVRPDEPCRPALQEFPRLHHIDGGNPLGDADHQRQARIRRFHDGVGGKRRRNENDGRIGASRLHGRIHGIEDGPVRVGRAALSGSHTADYVRAVGDRLKRVKRALLSRKALHDEACILIDEDAHCFTASLTTFSAASRMPSATVKLNPDSARILRPCSTFVPSMRTTRGTWILRSRAAATTPVASVSQRRMPPKILISTAFTLASESRIRNAFLTCSALAPPPTSRKFAGLPPAYWMMSIVPMASPAPFTMHPTLPSSLM